MPPIVQRCDRSAWLSTTIRSLEVRSAGGSVAWRDRDQKQKSGREFRLRVADPRRNPRPSGADHVAAGEHRESAPQRVRDVPVVAERTVCRRVSFASHRTPGPGAAERRQQPDAEVWWSHLARR